MLGFNVAVNGSLVRYNLVDQSIDEYFDACGVDAISFNKLHVKHECYYAEAKHLQFKCN